MGIIGWILLGLIAGAIAKAIHKGNEPGGILATMVVGILGAILGGVIASAVGVGDIDSFFSIGTWLIAIGGALLLLFIYNAVTSGGGRRSVTHG
ncbi:MAG: GlsB/YeaQ/YmgE family stress response membrane protein [Solirubrobacteraceae bacterium]|nr:GlsB/YeaQ/YmgE family stress response membrane protein [Solirubrobacteraceae bacterium]